MLKFRCGDCKQKIGVPEEYAGKRVRCPRCKRGMTVPRATETAAEAPPAVAASTTPQPVDTAGQVDAPPLVVPPSPVVFPAPEPVVVAPPPPDLASVFAQYLPAGVDPVHASLDDLWQDRLPTGAQPSVASAPAVEQSGPLNLSQTMEVDIPRPLTAEVMETPSPRRERPVRSSGEEVNDLLRELSEPGPPPAVPRPYPQRRFHEFEDGALLSSSVHAEPERPLPRPTNARRRSIGTQPAMLGMAGVLLGLGAVALYWAAGAARFAVPIATAGLLLALTGAILSAARNASGIALPATGTIASAVGIAVPVLGAFGIIPLPGRAHVSVAGSTPVVNVSLPPSDGTGLQAPQRIPADGFIPATSPLIAGQMQVRISSVRIVQPVVHDGHWNAIHSLPDKRLVLSLEVKDLAPDGRISYRTWAKPNDGGQATLTDGAGNSLKQVDPDPLVPLGRVSENPASVYAGRSAVPDVLIFERPADTSGDLKLDLPGANVGLPATTLHIRIPAQMVQS